MNRSAGAHRVLLVETNEDGTEGGSHRALLDLVRGLDRSRFEPLVLLYQPGAIARRLSELCIPVVDWSEVRETERGYGGEQPLLRRVHGLGGAVERRVRLLRSLGIDLVHVNNSPTRGFDDWLPAARLCGVPAVSHLRGPFVPLRTHTGAWLQRRFDAVIAVSRWIAATATAGGVSPDRVHVAYDGVDLTRIAAESQRDPGATRAALGLASDDFAVLLAGNLRPWKGQQQVLSAIPQLAPTTRKRLRLLIAGATPSDDVDYARRLHEEIDARELGACVFLLGPRTDLWDLMRAADVVLHASTLPEPIGLVVLEAMALGRAVVASHLGGPAEVIQGDAGLFFDPAHPESLAPILDQLESQPELRERLGSAARAQAARFDVQKTVAGVTEVWDRVLRTRVPGSP